VKEDKDKKERGEVSRRDFLVGAGAVVVGGAIGAGITYPLVKGDGGEVTTVTQVKTVPTTVTTTAGAGATVTETVDGGGGVQPWQEPEETTVSTASGNARGGIAAIDRKHGRIVRIRPLHYDEKYTEAELAASSWKYEGTHRKTGATMTFESSKHSGPPVYALAHKKHTYSPNRLLYPLQRVDWEPGGDPVKINTQNRGKSMYKRISWDEATEIIASEIKRVYDKYGPLGLFDKCDCCHAEIKNIHEGAGCTVATSGLMGPLGSSTVIRNADSWEGYYYGAMHVWGMGAMGAQPKRHNLLKDITENTDMMVYQGCDWDTTSYSSDGDISVRIPRWFHHLGLKEIYISPDYNWQQASNPDKWIPIIPGRDDALYLAIIHTWLKEDTWDKDYIATHAVGMQYIEDYVMGRSDDMVEKTPAWAAPRCGVPEWTIKALAREWAKNRTTIGIGNGGPKIRSPFSHECARLEVVVLGMQGLGRLGVNETNLPGRPDREPISTMAGGLMVRFGPWSGSAAAAYPVPQKQIISRVKLSGAILEGTSEQWGLTARNAPPEDQFIKYTYPAPPDEGGTRIHFLWEEAPCQIGCWNDANKYIHALRDPSIECHITHGIWLETDCLFADIALPINTVLEEDDIHVSGGDRGVLHYQAGDKKPIESLGESKSDYEAVLEVAKKLEQYGGQFAGIVDQYTGGKTIDEWIKFAFDHSGADQYISWDKLKEVGYWVIPTDPDWEKGNPGFFDFYDNPEQNPLGTPSGKLEFYSQRIADNFPDDNERGPYPKYQLGGPGCTHDESLITQDGAEKCTTMKDPLLVIANHCRWRVHVQFDDIPSLREIPVCKVKGYDGYMYEPVWINEDDAAARGIKPGDIVKVSNERGIELFGAHVSKRVRPGAVLIDHGSRFDPIGYEDEEYQNRGKKWINRGGTMNTITPYPGLSEHAPGMCVSSFLVEVEKVTGDEMQGWRDEYPEAFARDYDPAYGLLSGAWIEGGK